MFAQRPTMTAAEKNNKSCKKSETTLLNMKTNLKVHS